MLVLLFLFISPIYASFPGGTPCALHSQCESNQCLGYCCESSIPNCGFCYGDGKCASCIEGWELINDRCYPSHEDGAPCDSNSFCLSKVCKKKCCSRNHGHCVECTTYGSCAECEKGFFLDPDTRICMKQKEIGEDCERYVLNQCKTVCKSHCCDLEKMDPNCDSCDEEGKCTACKYGYKWTNQHCIATSLRAGSKCDQDSVCEQGKCIGGYCCNQPGCLACSKYGICIKCKENYSLTDGFCTPLKYFTCARSWNMIQKRFCNYPKRIDQRCCWICDQPCRYGLKCEAISNTRGVCVKDYSAD